MKISKHFEEVIEYVWKRCKAGAYGQEIEFDYPDYDGFPKKMRLNSDQVDAIQDSIAQWVHWGGISKKDFIHNCLKYEARKITR